MIGSTIWRDTILGKGQMGSALIRSLRISHFLTEGLFGHFPLIYFYLPRSARACLFPQSVKKHYFCSGPLSVDPICPQPKVGGWRKVKKTNINIALSLLNMLVLTSFHNMASVYQFTLIIIITIQYKYYYDCLF